MPEFTAKDVQTLRKSTGSGMMDAKRALEATGGDMDDATKWLREHGLGGVAKRADRQTGEGTVALATTERAGAIVELLCETDFVAKSPELVGFAEELAELLVKSGEKAFEEREAALDDLRTTLKENITIGRAVHLETDESSILGSYLHVQNRRGVNAVLVELRGGTPELAHDIAVHIASQRPLYIARDEVPESDVAEERATVERMARNEGKPEAALAKIVDGRMNAFYKDRVLLEQAFVRDEKKTIADLLGSAEVVRFAQVALGG
jgi:elongation factor Ts